MGRGSRFPGAKLRITMLFFHVNLGNQERGKEIFVEGTVGNLFDEVSPLPRYKATYAINNGMRTWCYVFNLNSNKWETIARKYHLQEPYLVHAIVSSELTQLFPQSKTLGHKLMCLLDTKLYKMFMGPERI